MPTEEQNTAKLTSEQIKIAKNLWDRAGKGDFYKDPANPPGNPHPHMKEGVAQPEDKQF